MQSVWWTAAAAWLQRSLLDMGISVASKDWHHFKTTAKTTPLSPPSLLGPKLR
jgi:hypothetical protein